MKRALYLAAFLVLLAGASLAEEKKEDPAVSKPKPDTVFQKVGDFITGEYDVNGKPLKKAGVFQVMADEVKKIEPAPVR